MTSDDKRRFLESLPTVAEYRAIRLRNAAYHARVQQKFERAARRLWEALPDDPLDPLWMVIAGLREGDLSFGIVGVMLCAILVPGMFCWLMYAQMCTDWPIPWPAASMMASEYVGCGCMASRISSSVASSFLAITSSAISSVACEPIR